MAEPLIRLNEADVVFRLFVIWIQTVLGAAAVSVALAEYQRYRSSKTFRLLLEGSVGIFLWVMGCAILSEMDVHSPGSIPVRMIAEFSMIFFMAICVSVSARVSDMPRKKRRQLTAVYDIVALVVFIAMSLRNFLPPGGAGELPLFLLFSGRLLQLAYAVFCAGGIAWICRGWKKRLRFKRQERLRKKLAVMAVMILGSALVDLLIPVFLRTDIYAISSFTAFAVFCSMLGVALARKKYKMTILNAFTILAESQTEMAMMVVGADRFLIEELNEKAAFALQKKPEEILGHRLEDFFDSGLEVEDWEARAGSDTRTFYYHVREKRSRTPFRLSIYNIHDDFGEAFMGLVFLEDLSDREEMLEELNKNRDAAREAREEAKFNAEFVDEFGSQVHAVLKEVSRLSFPEEEGEEPSDLSRRLEEIHFKANALLFRVSEALDYSRIETGQAALQVTEYEPLKLVDEISCQVRREMREKGLEFTIYVNPSLPSRLKGDSGRIRQVLLILLNNAARYTEQGFVSLSLDCENRDNGVFLQIEVSDSGIGVPAERQERIFDSTGNLSSAQKLIDLMEGSINIRSVPGKGTVFTMIFPQEVTDEKACLLISGAEQIVTATFLPASRTAEAFYSLLEAMRIRNIPCSYPPELMHAAHNGARTIFVDESLLAESHLSAMAAPGGVRVVVLTGQEEEVRDGYERIILPEFGEKLKALFEEESHESQGIS